MFSLGAVSLLMFRTSSQRLKGRGAFLDNEVKRIVRNNSGSKNNRDAPCHSYGSARTS